MYTVSDDSVLSHRKVQTRVEFPPPQDENSIHEAARQSKQVRKLLFLLELKARSLDDTIKSFVYVVGEPDCRGRQR